MWSQNNSLGAIISHFVNPVAAGFRGDPGALPVTTIIRPISISDLAQPTLHFQRSASSASFTNQNQVQHLSCTHRKKGGKGLHDQRTKVSPTHLLCSRTFAWHLSHSPGYLPGWAQKSQDIVEGEKPYCIMTNIHRYPITCLFPSVFSRGGHHGKRRRMIIHFSC